MRNKIFATLDSAVERGSSKVRSEIQELLVSEFLDPKRPAVLGGHGFGFQLSAEQRAALVRELEQW